MRASSDRSGMCPNESSKLALRRSPRLLAKYALRRSLRLIGKSATTMPKGRKLRKSVAKDHGTDNGSSGDIEKIMRADREHEAIHFKNMYKLEDDCPEIKTCIHPRGSFVWSKSSFGITWVAVRGTDNTIVAFRKSLARDCRTSYLAYNPAEITFNFLGTSIISEIEVLADLPSGKSQKFPPEACKGQNVEAPFAIVSVVSDTVNDENEAAALDYLRDTIEKGKGRSFDFFKAKLAAVRALQKLHGQTFKPEDIWVHQAFHGVEEGLSYIKLRLLLDLINRLDTLSDGVQHAFNEYKDILD